MKKIDLARAICRKCNHVRVNPDVEELTKRELFIVLAKLETLEQERDRLTTENQLFVTAAKGMQPQGT